MVARRSVLVAPGEGEVVLRGGIGVVRKISAASDGAFSVVEHPLEPGALAAPPHTHADVDEYSFVIEGEELDRVQGALDRRRKQMGERASSTVVERRDCVAARLLHRD